MLMSMGARARVSSLVLLLAIVAACTSTDPSPSPSSDPSVEISASPTPTPTVTPSPSTSPTPNPVAGGPSAPRRLRAWAREGSFHLTRVRHVADVRGQPELQLTLTGVSPDGSLASYVWYRGDRVNVGVLDLRDGSRLGVLSLPSDRRVGEPRFSPDGRRILLQVDRSIQVWEPGRPASEVARTVDGYTSYAWLSDGRVAFVDQDRHIALAHEGGRVRQTSYMIQPRPSYASPDERWAIDPQGKRLIIWNDCGVDLVNLASGETRTMPLGLEASSGSWSPDGNRFFLSSGGNTVFGTRWYVRHCGRGGPRWQASNHDKLFSRDGRDLTGRRFSVFGDGLSFPHGHSLDWSPEGDLAVAVQQSSGTCAVGFRSMNVVSVEGRLWDMLIEDRVGSAHMGPDGMVVFLRYDRNVHSICDLNQDNDFQSGAIYAGRLDMAG
jgi:WD40 repeat protein